MKNQTSGIYAIVHIESGRKYIGSAVSIQKRWDLHRHGLKSKKHHSAVLQKAWEKYGSEAFSFVVLEVVENKADLLKREQHWIDTEGCLAPSGFNLCPTAGNTFGRRFSEETKAKMSEQRKGRKASEETRRKMSEARRGIPKSDQHKKAIGAAHKGKPCTEKRRAAVAKANSERVHSPETKAKLSAAGRARYQKLRAQSAENQIPEPQRDPRTGQMVDMTRRIEVAA